MLILASPAKRLDFESEISYQIATSPKFLDQAAQIVEKLSTQSVKKLATTLNISDSLAELNQQRYLSWTKKHTRENSRPAIYAYSGDVYNKLTPKTYTDEQQTYAEMSLRIISGLYGILKPYDLIQPYRLEMGLKFNPGKARNLQEYWRDDLTEYLIEEIEYDRGHELILNVASQEYSKAIDLDELGCDYFNVIFRQKSKDKYRSIMLPTKHARGMMIDYLIKHKVTKLDGVRKFDLDGYKLHEESHDSLLFVKD